MSEQNPSPASEDLAWVRQEDGKMWRAKSVEPFDFSIWKDGEAWVIAFWINRFKTLCDHGILYDSLDAAQEACEKIHATISAAISAALRENDEEAQHKADTAAQVHRWALERKDAQIAEQRTVMETLKNALEKMPCTNSSHHTFKDSALWLYQVSGITEEKS